MEKESIALPFIRYDQENSAFTISEEATKFL
jgi:hypothetical protein